MATSVGGSRTSRMSMVEGLKKRKKTIQMNHKKEKIEMMN